MLSIAVYIGFEPTLACSWDKKALLIYLIKLSNKINFNIILSRIYKLIETKVEFRRYRKNKTNPFYC